MSPRAATESELLASLGLSEAAGPSEIDAAHADVVAFLEDAPHDLHGWARRQIAAADEAYALLSDPDLLREATRSQAKASRTPAPPKPAKGRTQADPKPASTLSGLRTRRLGPIARIALGAGAVLATLGAAYLVYASDVPAVPGLSGTFAPEDGAPVLDTARVGVLMEAIQTDPNDIAALQELGDLYFQVADYQTAASWEERVLAVAPDDVTAHLALGAAQYNLGNSADAEAHWRRVLEIDTADIDAVVEAHYDLGFMYFSADPPDVDQTIAEWRQVVELAPGSDIAQTVSTHLETLEEWQSSASPTTGSSPTATQSPSPSSTP